MSDGLRLAVMCLLGLLFPATVISAGMQEAVPVDVSVIIAEALSRNPDLQAAEARWRVFERKIIPARTLDDPRLSISLANYPTDTFNWDQTPMTGQVLRFSQPFPFPGKLEAKGRIAEAQSLWYRSVYDDLKLQIIRQVKEAWYNLYLQDRMLERTEASLALLVDLIRLTENRYETGKGIQQDVLKAQVERSILMERSISIGQQRETARANINALRNVPSDTSLLMPTEIEPPTLGYSREELQEQAAALRPLAKAYQALIRQYGAQADLARLDYYPDFFAGAAYTIRQKNMADDGTDFASVEFGMTLPLYREKRREMEAEAETAGVMARRQFDDFLNKARLNIHDAHAQMEKNRQLMALYRGGIVPQATQSLEAAMSGYQVGKISLIALLDTMLTLYRYEVEYYRAVSEYGKNIARLEAEAGLTAEKTRIERGSP